MMEQILVRLPIKSLLRFMTICREWYSLISSDSHFQTATLHHQQQSSQHQLIAWTQPISHVGKLTGAYCLVLDHLPRYNWHNYPFVHWKRLQFLGFCNGLVAMYSGDGLYYDVSSNEYKVVYMGLDRDIHVQSFKTGESKLVLMIFIRVA
ncbi:hypothetical protein Ancab_021773 [Ancistrocladus abbreviatus]